jgi:hypothetical protein
MNDALRSMRELHDEYAEQVNLAVAEGRDDLIDVLSARFAAARAARSPARQQLSGPPPPGGMA